MKSYLTIAVIVLSGITSMGIFGFLSKSHIEQEAGSYQYSSQISMLDKKLDSINSQKLNLESEKSTNEQLNQEDYNSLNRLNNRLKDLDASIAHIRDKGGFSVSSKIKAEQSLQSEERLKIAQQKESIEKRLASYRDILENKIFPKTRELDSEYLKINLDKSELESKLKTLEAEIGPIKYIAELMSDFGGPNLATESAVRIVILILIFVFDPLAILLVVAGSSTFKSLSKDKVPQDLLEYRNKLLMDLELHLGEGKSVESFIEKYQI